jgi:precorrin-3B methylase
LQNHPKRVAIIASNVGRDKQQVTITDTKELVAQGLEHPQVTMSTLIIIGNSTTRLTKNNLVLTPRGYLNKYELDGKIKESK